MIPDDQMSPGDKVVYGKKYHPIAIPLRIIFLPILIVG